MYSVCSLALTYTSRGKELSLSRREKALWVPPLKARTRVRFFALPAAEPNGGTEYNNMKERKEGLRLRNKPMTCLYGFSKLITGMAPLGGRPRG